MDAAVRGVALAPERRAEAAALGVDERVLEAFIAELDEHDRVLAAGIAEHGQRVCGELHARGLDGLDAVYWATALAALLERHEAERTERHVAWLQSLPARARAWIEREAAAAAVGLISIRLDWVGLAAASPDVAARMIVQGCPGRERPAGLIASTWYLPPSGPNVENKLPTRERPAAPRDSESAAMIHFDRIVPPEELVAMLRGSGLELDAVLYRDIGPGEGNVSFTPGAEPAAALAAAAERVTFEKRARALGAARGADAVILPADAPGGGGAVYLREPRRLDGRLENALRPTREEIESLPLPDCALDRAALEPLENVDAATEAACGFRPHAIVVRGDPAAIDAFRAAQGRADGAQSPAGTMRR